MKGVVGGWVGVETATIVWGTSAVESRPKDTGVDYQMRLGNLSERRAGLVNESGRVWWSFDTKRHIGCLSGPGWGLLVGKCFSNMNELMSLEWS